MAIGDLSLAAGVSNTHLAQRFKEVIGFTPKRLARTYRFAAAVRATDPASPVDWLEIAHHAGYYDQAHFGHNFRTFTGVNRLGTSTVAQLGRGHRQERRQPPRLEVHAD